MRYSLFCAAAVAVAFPFAVLADDAQPGDKIDWKPAAQAPSDSSSAPTPAPSTHVIPASTGPHFGFSGALGYEYGGDDIATVIFTDGSSENLKAGSGLVAEVGGNFRPSKRSPWITNFMVGYKYQSAGATNGSLSFARVPIELTQSYQWSNGIQVGLGPVYHTAIRFSSSGDLGSAPSVNFKNAFGGEIQAGWKYVVLTYTFIKYKDDFGDNISGNNVGIRGIYNF